MSAVSVSESGMRGVLADAAEVARRALVALEPDGVGVHLGVTVEDDTAATHRFEATLPGYRGWQWAVVVAAPPGADYATVSESALLPAIGALIAPDFIPWDQRVRPGDLGPGDLLATPADDPRLVPGYIATGDPVIDDVAREVGLGRVQVLSVEGRADAAQRWFAEFGPDTEMAKAAPSTCGMCGFYLPLAGALRESFGVCGNAMGADGHVVNIAYGCGAHSDVIAPSGNGSPLYEAFDDHAVDFVEIVRPAVEDATAADPAEAVDAGEDAITADEAIAADPETVVVEVVGETADPAVEVVEVAAGTTAADPVIETADVVAEQRAAADSVIETADAAAEQGAADALTEVGEVAAEQAGDRQETAEAEAVAAVEAERAALAEGAKPESADEVVTAEVAADVASVSVADGPEANVTEASVDAPLNGEGIATVTAEPGSEDEGAQADSMEHGSSVSR
ncbi:DUF3027 domain-containing protein [Nocardia sp. NPDC058666]|uniref:DUF3027 domain-containing protein n=1 Tax=Nocardia sp. NPDC058666 TaxID=3346587 RepID=UPI0036531A04